MNLRVLFEHDSAGRPHSSAHIRLLQPFTHPRNLEVMRKHGMTASFGRAYDGEPNGVVIVDRLWRPDVTPQLVGDLISAVRRAGAKLIFSLDDNFLDLPIERFEGPPEGHLAVFNILLDEADGVIVTTPALASRLADRVKKIVVVQNLLDERLICGAEPARGGSARSDESGQIVIGYMGSFTHDEDLELIMPALSEVKQRLGKRIVIEIIGATRTERARRSLEALRAVFIPVPRLEGEYPSFMLWFTSCLKWDVAVAPLRESAFAVCKSDLKFLDFSAIGAASILSDLAPYQAVRHGYTGIVVKNTLSDWRDGLLYLAMNTGARRQISRNAWDDLRENRLIVSAKTPTLSESILQLLA